MRFDHVGVVVEDLESACAFARDVLGPGAPATEVRVDDFGGFMWQLTEVQAP
jgi:catechol 2,3-dioxygenase-like lactoylglutathione lyase family enzyme